MIQYSPKKWTAVTFAWRGTVLSRLLFRIGGYASLTAVVWGWHIRIAPLEDLGALAHSLVGVALGMLLVFRTNSSYDRFWEGRKRWGGIVNASRSLVRGAVAHTGEARELAPLVAAYVYALKQHLRFDKDLAEARARLPGPVYEAAVAAANPPSIIALAMSRWVAERVADGRVQPALALTLEERVTELLDHQGACERILKTPVPFAYVAQIRQLLSVYLVTLPFVLVPMLGGLAVPAVALIVFGLVGIEEAGVEIEDPFGTDSNDLPLEDLCATIERDTVELART